jgi:glycerol-3-phosphate dehydrogenase (NAD(P)+)
MALKLAKEKNIEVPITEQVHAVLFEGRDPKSAVQALMTRDPRGERE